MEKWHYWEQPIEKPFEAFLETCGAAALPKGIYFPKKSRT